MENKINIKCEKYTSFFSLGLDVRLLKISKKVLALMEKLCGTLEQACHLDILMKTQGEKKLKLKSKKKEKELKNFLKTLKNT